MRRILHLIFFLTLLAIGLSFALLNAERVALNYYFGTTQGPVSLIVVASMAFGALLGVVASLGLVFSHRRESRRLKRKLSVCEEEIKNLRRIPITD